MKRIFLFLSFLFLFLFNFSRAEDNTNTYRKTQIGFTISPDLCYRKLTNGFSYRYDLEKPKLGYTLGASVWWQLRKKIGLELGLSYSNKGYKFKFNDFSFLTYGDFIDPTKGFVFNTGPTADVKGKYVYNFSYIEVPFKLTFLAGTKSLHFFYSVGVAPGFLFYSSTKSIVSIDGEEPNVTKNATPFNGIPINISPLLSIGINYNINDKSNLRIEPLVKYGLIDISGAATSGEFLWSAGLSISCFFIK
ncbi:MAG: outer membrane beta-barrel protein [Bacteroidetes bacterium]|nr:outer membrane beta-barrel protein [Bacteroidota bacterium]